LLFEAEKEQYFKNIKEIQLHWMHTVDELRHEMKFNNRDHDDIVRWLKTSHEKEKAHLLSDLKTVTSHSNQQV
jgi:hypothetical protein